MPNKLTQAPLPGISIVTPSYNQGRFLEQCIQSVLNQNYPNLEYIIIDGGSTDNSVDTILKYQADITYWVSEPDRGQNEAINKGLQHATGDLVAWLNSDDFFLPQAFHHVATVYLANPTAPFLFGNGLRVDVQGRTKRLFFPKGSLRFDREALAYGLNYILQPATFINRQWLNQVGGLSTTLSYGFDTDLWLRLSALGQPVPVEAILAASREYETTKTSSGSFVRIEELRQIAESHTGLPITPGVICYFLDTLYRLAQEKDDLFSGQYRRDILRFWSKTSLMMDQFGAAPNGIPLPPGEQNSPFHRLRRAGKVYL
jgi:GT2 family glycosyltransferase